jgi:hypothetical protein
MVMNSNELADELNRLQKIYPLTIPFTLDQAATMLRQQQEQIDKLTAIVALREINIKQQQEEKKALYNLVAEQDKKIIDLAFKLAYAERSNEIVMEANTRSRP